MLNIICIVYLIITVIFMLVMRISILERTKNYCKDKTDLKYLIVHDILDDDFGICVFSVLLGGSWIILVPFITIKYIKEKRRK